MIGFTLAKTPVQRRFVIMAPEHLADTRKPIPAGAANFRSRGELKFKQDVDLAWFMPHMHLRGKDMTFQLIYPNRQKEMVLSARFNFHWQLGYELGDLTSQEMMVPWFGVIVDGDPKPESIASYKQKGTFPTEGFVLD